MQILELVTPTGFSLYIGLTFEDIHDLSKGKNYLCLCNNCYPFHGMGKWNAIRIIFLKENYQEELRCKVADMLKIPENQLRTEEQVKKDMPEMEEDLKKAMKLMMKRHKTDPKMN